MAESKLTLQQQLACDHKRNLCVSAGAGSGKTEVLTRRVIHILKQHQIDLSRILVVTFTDKAASQMRDRVYQAIQQQISQNDKHLPYWLQLKENFSANYISTFHAFCAKILREYSVEAGLDPDFCILNEHEQYDLLYQVIADKITELAYSPKADLLNRLIRLWRREVLIEQIMHLIDRRSQSQVWITQFSNLTPEQYLSQLKNYQRLALSEVIGELQNQSHFNECLDILDNLRRQSDNKTKKEAEILTAVGPLCSRLKQLHQLPTEVAFELLQQVNDHINLRGLRDSGLKQGLEKLRELLKDSHIFDLILEPDLELKGYEILSALTAITSECLSAYRKQKENNACLDFEDLQLLSLNLLQDTRHPHIKSELRSRFCYVMVDEFQDTNPIQWQILKLLSSNAQGLLGDKLFIVGDEKQSIYAFRGADVTVFAQARAELVQANLNHQTDTLPFELPAQYTTDYTCLDNNRRRLMQQGEVCLEHNFRSAPGIMDFINPFFKRLFKREHYRLYDARPQTQICERNFSDARVELMLVEQEKNQSTTGQAYERIDDYLKEAHLIAKKIKYILKHKPREYSNVLAKIEQKEPAIAILLSRRNKIKIYEEALRREEIDFLVSKGRGFYQRQEIRDIINALEFISQPQADIPLAGVLRSPLIGLSDDGLLAINSLDGRDLWERCCSIFSAKQPPDLPEGLLPGDRQLLPRAFQMLCDWIRLKDSLPLSELINKMLDDSQLYGSLASGRRGSQNLANLEKLMELATEYERSGKGGIWEWSNYLKRRLKQTPHEGEAEVDPLQGETVQLMTIHQAKGLEFPLVFVPDLSAPLHLPRINPLLQDNISDGFQQCWEIGIKAPDPNDNFKPRSTLIRKIIDQQNKQKSLAEKRRLLYVAASRARDHLILVGQISKKPASQARCWQDWISDILGIDSPAGLKSVFISDYKGKGVQIPLTLFDHSENISPYQEPPVIQSEHIDRQVERSAASDELYYIIRQLKPLPISERQQFSATGLLEYRHCPRRYYYRYRLRIPEWIGEGKLDPSFSKTQNPAPNMAILTGTIVHNLLENGFSDEIYIKTCINKILPGKASIDEQNNLKDEVLRHIKHIQQCPDYLYWHSLEQQSYQELKFQLNLDGAYLVGSIDQLHFDSRLGEWVIVDYKTNELGSENNIPKEIKERGYDFQLMCYCLAAEHLLREPVVNAQLLFSHFPRLEKLRFSTTDLDCLKHEIKDLIKKINAGQYDPLPQNSLRCANCGYCQLADITAEIKIKGRSLAQI
jgi:ATP-dependent helicase/nuclease subunit A